MKRDDLIHPVVSGNKWRKLKYNVQEATELNLKGIVTFGGAFSNHIAAMAYAGKIHNLQTIGIIRGEEVDFNNPTLSQARENGMHLVPISREAYRRKAAPDFLEELKQQYSEFLIVPEGGANLNGVKGCAEILNESIEAYDLIVCPMGTATTFAGIVASAATPSKVWGFPALKGGAYLRADVNNFLVQWKASRKAESTLPRSFDWQLITDYHFGGFGKMKEPLVRFMNAFWKETGIPLDPVYTSKMMFGLQDLLEKDSVPRGSRILAIHTGGLQGIAGMNARLQNKNYSIEYEHKI